MSKTVLVTGAMGGLGTAICTSFAKEGYKVIAAYHPKYDDHNVWVANLPSYCKDIDIVEGDVSDYESTKTMVKTALEHNGKIDILINNAGITKDKYFSKMDEKMWTDVITTNLNSIFNVTHHVSQQMVENGWGRIINISSVNGVRGQAGQTNYASAKAGILGFTKSLAQELVDKGVTVNAIAPGYIGTPMVNAIKPEVLDKIVSGIPMKRLGKPEEIGALCLYLASDLAGYMTGATMNINGGLHMC